jgi:hypothetical protein
MSIDLPDTSSAKHFSFESLFFLLALAFNLFVALYWIRQPLTDYHAFRQTQTAMSVYWIQEDGRWLDLPKYETPVFGYPWQVPLEFPIYQWFVAVAYHVTHISVDVLGRGISSLFFYACFWPIYMVAEGLGLNRRLFFLAAALLMLSPMYLYWSRTFMIESATVFFCFVFLAYVQKFLGDSPCRALWWMILTFAGLAGILLKVTTFPTFAVAAGILVLFDMSHVGNWKNLRRWMWIYLPLALSVGLMLVSVLGWVKFADVAKGSNIISTHITSANMQSWTWGTWPQRTSQLLWITTILGRIIPHTLGTSIMLAPILAGFIVAGRRSKGMILLLLVLFLTDILLFTNLHIDHDYYPYATALFLVFAMAVSYWALAKRWRKVYYIACLLTVAIFIGRFGFTYGRWLNTHPTDDPQIQSAYFVDSATPRDSVILIVGCDWSPVVAYYSQRRAIYLAHWMTPQAIDEVFAHPESFTEGRAISAIVEDTQGDMASVLQLADTHINPLLPSSRVAHFGDYRVILLPLTAAQQSDLSGLKRLVLNRPLDESMRGFVKRSRQRINGLGNQ